MYTFIVNPNSRSQRGHMIWEKIEPILLSRNINYEVFFTKYQKHAAQITGQVTGDGLPHTVIAVGGDGTVNEVINGICDFSKTTFGYIPSGSGNDFAKGMNLPSDPLEALENILHPNRILEMDLAETELKNGDKKKFTFSSGIGFDAAVCHQSMVSPIKSVLNRLHLGKLTYTLIAIGRLIYLHPADLSLTLHTGSEAPQTLTYRNTVFAAAMNLPYEGGGFKFCPDASPEDDTLDLIVVSGLSRPGLVFVLLPALFGRHTFSRHVHILRCKKAELHLSSSLPVHTDGEPVTAQNIITFTVIPDKLKLLT